MLIKYTVIATKGLMLVKPTITKYDGLLKSLPASKNFSGNWPLKGPSLGSADKYTTLLPLAWPIKPEFNWQIIWYKVTICCILIC